MKKTEKVLRGVDFLTSNFDASSVKDFVRGCLVPSLDALFRNEKTALRAVWNEDAQTFSLEIVERE